MTSTHQVRDGSRLLTFEGARLGTVTSKRDGVPRWTEMSVFKTVGGQYVLEKVGRSVVTHMPGCPEILNPPLPRFQTEFPGEDPDEGFEFHECVPEEYNFPQLLVENQRYWATISSEPSEIVDALYRRRDGGTRQLPRISIILLEEVTATDPDFGDDWRVEKIL